MKKQLFVTFLAATFLFLALPATASAWVALGQRSAHSGIDRDEIQVGAKEGEFRKIKLEVKVVAVQFSKVVVHFADGSEQVVELRDRVRAGGETRAIDLEGGSRVIDKVVFWYKTARARKRDGTVQLFGHR